MSEWLKEHAWKACVGETLPRVRIPLSPPIPAQLAPNPKRAHWNADPMTRRSGKAAKVGSPSPARNPSEPSQHNRSVANHQLGVSHDPIPLGAQPLRKSKCRTEPLDGPAGILITRTGTTVAAGADRFAVTESPSNSTCRRTGRGSTRSPTPRRGEARFGLDRRHSPRVG